MKTDMKTKVIARLSVASLLVVLLAGVFAGGTLVQNGALAQSDGVDDEALNKRIEKAVEKALNTEPRPRRTAYIDFLTLLKNDQPLLAMQSEIQLGIQSEVDAIDSRYIPLIRQQQQIKQKNKPDTRHYRQAMDKQLDLERTRFQEQLLLEQEAQRELRDLGIQRFKALRNLARDVAVGMGYNEVLNIVRDVEEVAAAQEDFKALQQQLLISPVLYFEPEHDLTDMVLEKADERWGSKISLDSGNVDVINEIEFTLKDAANPIERNEDGQIEIRLGQEGRFHIIVFEDGKALDPEDPDAAVVFSKAGVGVGELSEDGTFKASSDWPPRGEDRFVVYVRSTVDPSKTKRVTVKLLSKDGKTRPEAEKAEEEGGDDE